MKKNILTVLMLSLIILSGCGISGNPTNNKVVDKIIQQEAELDLGNKNEEKLIEANPLNATISSTNETEEVVESAFAGECGPQKGDTIVKGSYTLEVGEKKYDMGQLWFLKGSDYDKHLDYINVDGKEILVYYQYYDCGNLDAYFVSYDQEFGLRRMMVYYPAVEGGDYSVQVVSRVSQENVDGKGLTLATHPNGMGYPYLGYYVPSLGNNLENTVFMEFYNQDYDLHMRNEEDEQPDSQEIKDADYYSIHSKNIDRSLENIEQEEMFSDKTTREFDNGFIATIYEFAEASSFEYILDIQKDGKQQYVFTHVGRYEFSEDGKYLFVQNYQYDEYKDAWVEQRQIIDLESRQQQSFAYNYCFQFNGRQSFVGNKFLAYGQASNGENYGLVETEICVVDLENYKLKKYQVPMQRFACSTACPVDGVGLLEQDTDTLYISRADMTNAELESGSDAVSAYHEIYSFYDLSTVTNDGVSQQHMHLWTTDPSQTLDASNITFDSSLGEIVQSIKQAE